MYSYDTNGRVVKRYTFTQANGGTSVLTTINTTISDTFDLQNTLVRRALAVGSATWNHWYDFDNRGLLWKVFASWSPPKPGAPDVTYTYRPSGQIENRLFAVGLLVPFKYTIRAQIQSIGDPGVTTYPFSARYTYHPNQTLLETEFYSGGSPAAEKRYKYWFGEAPYYDALNRLKGGDFTHWSGGAWSPTAKYDLGPISYDPSGNLLTLQRRQDAGAVVDNLTYTIAPNSNRLTSVSEVVDGSPEAWDAEDGSFTYDANGNVKTATGAPYSITTPITYDYQNLALAITRSGTTTTYRYNEAGQRITKQGSTGDTEVYLLDGATSLGVFAVNSGGGIVSSYFNVLAGDKVVGRQQIQPTGSNRRFYHTDLLGSTRTVTDGVTGAVLESYDFEPWGLLMPGRTLGSGTKEGFTGKEQDAETGLDYFGARHYMPALARWTAVDPLAEKHPEWSPYNYVLNNPLALIDPDGRQVPAGMTYYQYRLARFRARQDEQAQRQTSESQTNDKHKENKNRRELEQHPACQPSAGGDFASCMAVVTKPIQDAADVVGEATGLYDLARAGDDLIEGDLGGAALSAAMVVPLPGGRQGITIGRKAIRHILRRHGALSLARNASKFASGVNIEELVRAAEGVTPAVGRHRTLVRVVDAGLTIGVDRATGRATSLYAVITDLAGNLITAHPGLP